MWNTKILYIFKYPEFLFLRLADGAVFGCLAFDCVATNCADEDGSQVEVFPESAASLALLKNAACVFSASQAYL